MNRFLKLIGQLISARPSIFNRISKKALLTPIVDHPSLEFLKTTQFSKRLNHFPHTETFHIKKDGRSSLITERNKEWLENDLDEEEQTEILDHQQYIINIQQETTDIIKDNIVILKDHLDTLKHKVNNRQNIIKIEQRNIKIQQCTIKIYQLLCIVFMVNLILK